MSDIVTPVEAPTITTKGKKLSKSHRRFTGIVDGMPDSGLRGALDLLALNDPVVWTMYYRRLRGNPMVFDMARRLAPEVLKAKAKGMSKREFESYVKITTLRHRPFMLAPLRDQHPHKCYKKGRQVGISELSLTEVVWFLWANPGTKWIYTFPRDTQLKDFSNTRINEAFSETPRMRQVIGIPNQVYLKRIGESFMVLRSAWESNLGEGVDADGVTLDEKDRMKEGVDIAFRESLSSSRFGYLREVSTPTLPGRGIDASWVKSDQRCWLVRCTRCGLEQAIEYPENIVQKRDIKLGTKELQPGTYEYECRKVKCRGKLDRINGRWVAKHPLVKNVRGYHMPQTIANWITATDVMQKKIDYKFMQLWMNYVLGEVSKGENILLTDTDFAMADAGHQLITQRTPDWSHISCGIDWGHQNWLTVLGKNTNGRDYIVNIGITQDDEAEELRSVKAMESLIAPFNPDIIVADAGYGKDRNAYLLRKFGEGRFYACQYNPSTAKSRTFTPVWSDAGHRVLCDRTMTIKVTCRAIKEREFGLPSRELDIVQLLEAHFKNLAPMRIEEDGEIFEDIQCSGDDHLVHSTAYAYLGMDYLTQAGHFSFDFV